MKIEDGLERIYTNRFSEAERRAKTELWRTLCAAFFGPRYVAATDTVLDIGAGYCDFINNIRAAHKLAVDLNPDTRRFASADVEVHALPLERMGEAIDAASVDLAFASNVFEHMRGPDALLEVLAAVFRDQCEHGNRRLIRHAFPNLDRTQYFCGQYAALACRRVV